MKKPYKDYKSIIWLRLDSIGDAILSSSMLVHIKGKFNNASITIVCQKHVAELYESCPFVDNIIMVHSGRREPEPLLLSRIKEKNPDLLLNSVFSKHQLSDTNGIEFIPERISFRGSSYTQNIPHIGAWEPELLKHKRFLEGLGIKSPKLLPQVWLVPGDLAGTYFVREDSYIVLFAGVRTKERFYDRYWEALKGLDKFVVLLGSKDDYHLNQEQLDKSGCKGINLSGRLTLKESIFVIKFAAVAVGGETGLGHAASAVETPNVILLGGGHYERFMPYGSWMTIVDNKMDCFKCNWICKGRDFACVKKIEPSKIRAAIEGKLIK